MWTSEERTTSLQRTKAPSPICPLFGGFTCMLRAMPRAIWSLEAVLPCRRLKHRNMSLSRSRVGLSIDIRARSNIYGLRLHLCDQGAGIHGHRVCTHYIDDLVPFDLCSYWGSGQVFHHRYKLKLVLEGRLRWYDFKVGLNGHGPSHPRCKHAPTCTLACYLATPPPYVTEIKRVCNYSWGAGMQIGY